MPSKGRREHLNSLLLQSQLLEQANAITPELIQTFPGLAWIKRYVPERRTYVMVLLSEEYISTLLGPRFLDYVGKEDKDFWGVEIAGLFWANDERARLGEKRWVTEPFISPLTGKSGTFEGVKWSFVVSGVTYVAGIGRNGPSE
jgi:hypothetical protein